MADWVRVFWSAGGGVHRQVDLQIGSAAPIAVLQWDDGRPHRYVTQQVRLHIESLPNADIFEAGDRNKGLEVSHVYIVREADKDETIRDVPGDGNPTEPPR